MLTTLDFLKVGTLVDGRKFISRVLGVPEGSDLYRDTVLGCWVVWPAPAPDRAGRP